MVNDSTSQTDALEAEKLASVGHLLLKAARLFNERAIARANHGGSRLTQAHTRLFPYIDFAGTRITDLAKAAGISKQAVTQLVDEMEQVGVVVRTKDPVDGRAVRVAFTAKGRDALLEGLAILNGVESEVASDIGADAFRRLHADLGALIIALERR